MGALRKRAARAREIATNYRQMIESRPVDEHLVLLDARNGRAFLGNMFYIAKELVEDARYADFRIWASAGRSTYASTKRFLRSNGLERVNLALVNSKRYFELLATAKFLVSDVCFSANWTKRAGQVVWNTWHGTPVKCMGRRMRGEACTLDIPQKHLLAADYLSFPNYYSADRMLGDYMIDELFEGTLLFSGYPRNSVLFDAGRRQELRARLGLDGARVYAYLPTYRVLSPGRDTPADFREVLESFDARLEDDELVFAKLHPLCGDAVGFAGLSRVRAIPAGHELYDVLNICDGLVTDYSSVLFDFAATRRPVALCTFDKEDYLKSRGLYLSFDDLPFTQVKTAGEALDVLRGACGGASVADGRFLEEFCPWDGPRAASDLCARVFLGQKSDGIVERDCGGTRAVKRVLPPAAGGQGLPARRERLLVHVDERFFADGGFRARLLDGLCEMDLDTTGVYVSFEVPAQASDDVAEMLFSLPEEVRYFPLAGTYIFTPRELHVFRAAQRTHDRALAASEALPTAGYVDRALRECGPAFDNANRRNFAGLKPDAVVNFDTRHLDKLVRFSLLSCPCALVVPDAGAKGEGMPQPLLDWAQENYSALFREGDGMREISNFSQRLLHPV